MSSERDTCLQKADDAKQRAAQASEPFMKSAYEKVAEHWKLLDSFASIGDKFFNQSPPSGKTLGERFVASISR
jgi:hypothetical protein